MFIYSLYHHLPVFSSFFTGIVINVIFFGAQRGSSQYITVRIFKNTWFAGFADREGVTDHELKNVVKRLDAGQVIKELTKSPAMLLAFSVFGI